MKALLLRAMVLDGVIGRLTAAPLGFNLRFMAIFWFSLNPEAFRQGLKAAGQPVAWVWKANLSGFLRFY